MPNTERQRQRTSWAKAWAAVAVVSVLAVACADDRTADTTPSTDGPSTSSVAPASSDSVVDAPTDSSPLTTDPAPATDLATAAFPVTIEHKYGSTTIDELPERVVTVGLTDHDAFLALGVAPVGVTEWFGDHPYATWPWAQAALGDATPAVVGTVGEINFEQIAAARPDLIVGLYSGITDDEYEVLSEIAPTVAQPGEYVDFGIPWDEQTRTIGAIVGQSARAEVLVDEVEQQFAQARAAHPEFEGATGLVATPSTSTVWVYAPQDVRGRFMASLGFTAVDEITEMAGDEFGADISLERLDLIDVDALVWIVNDIEADRPLIEDEPLYSSLAVHSEGRAVYVENFDIIGGATSFVSVLSLPVLLDALLPMLAAAVDGDPTTEA